MTDTARLLPGEIELAQAAGRSTTRRARTFAVDVKHDLARDPTGWTRRRSSTRHHGRV